MPRIAKNSGRARCVRSINELRMLALERSMSALRKELAELNDEELERRHVIYGATSKAVSARLTDAVTQLQFEKVEKLKKEAFEAAARTNMCASLIEQRALRAA